MAAQRADTPPPVLRLVRDEDCSSESMWEQMLRLDVELPPAPRVAFFDLGDHVMVERAPPKEAKSADFSWVYRWRRGNRSAFSVAPAQTRLDLDRARRLSVYGQRPRSIGNGPLTRKDRVELKAITTDLRRAGVYRRRPKHYADCLPKTGPCPWVSCRHHLYLEVDEMTGAIKLNFPGLGVDELEQTCSLKVAAEGSTDGGYYGKGHTLERTGDLLNLTQERVRQVQREAVEKAKARYRRRDAGRGD